MQWRWIGRHAINLPSLTDERRSERLRAKRARAKARTAARVWMLLRVVRAAVVGAVSVAQRAARVKCPLTGGR